MGLWAQKPGNSDAFAHTFSILARDSETGQMAVGVQSHWFSVGTVVPWGQSGVGVVATQSFVNEAYGYEGLKLMSKNMSPAKVLEQLRNKDEGQVFRQVAMMSNNGEIAAFTGNKCVQDARHIIGENYSIQANMMVSENVVYNMRQAFEEHSDLALAERVVKALEAGQAAGGDIRGKQSAALIVVDSKPSELPWNDKLVDLRVDDHNQPIQELSRLLNVHRAYEYMAKGDLAMEEGNAESALEAYHQAEKLLPNQDEIQFWKAVALVNAKQVKNSIPVFERLFKKDKKWQELLKRLPASELIAIDQPALDYLLKL
ncbi:DUF1028 domain-containing protein [Psychroflexus aestuariivivens]|uniref:DUF1028 domain-containing protein n=1 Tax=Psychroflexus aestuariivivens TaxID=1795040 RepID=UPI001EFF7025|nr:DUF1028 domain-containing protein [Psychroflexus aestuariivivens]